jgi:hypothetical protein
MFGYQQEITMVERVTSLTRNQRVQALALGHKKTIQTAAWEDTARNKNSSWGPNICDFTLCVKVDRHGNQSKNQSTPMPLMRNPNFADQTLDQDYRSFPVVVGNEKSHPELKTTTIRDYLENLTQYSDAGKDTKSLWLDRDEKILTSTQACFLPLGKDGKIAFNGRLFNYQYDVEDPAILVILASAAGTSAQVVTTYNQELYFNDKGQAADFVAERLTQFREVEAKRTGEAVRTGAMTNDERSKNVIFMFQVPLKQAKKKWTRKTEFGYGGGMQCQSLGFFGSNDGDDDVMGACAGDYSPQSKGTNRHGDRETRGMEDAIVSTSETHGPFKGIGGKVLIRDERFPIRCTVQYYKVTDTDEIDAETIAGVAKQLDKVYDAVSPNLKGSLVVTRSADAAEKTERVTEPTLTPTNYGTFNVSAF